MNKDITIRKNQSVESLLKEAAEQPLLTIDQEVELANRIKQGDKGALRLSERGRVLGPFALHAHGRALDLAGRVHLGRHELAPLHRHALRRAPAHRLREHDHGVERRLEARRREDDEAVRRRRLPPGHALERL